MNIAGMILAAGNGSRFHGKKHKLLQKIGKKSIIRYTVENTLEAHFSTVLIVLGAQAKEIQEELEGLPIKFAYNQHWKEGQSTSIQTGMKALPNDIEAVCFILGDQPLVQPNTINQILRIQQEHPNQIIVPTFQDKRGNPTCFPINIAKEIGIDGAEDRGGRQLIQQYGAFFTPLDDQGILQDIDTQDDLRGFANRNLTAQKFPFP